MKKAFTKSLSVMMASTFVLAACSSGEKAADPTTAPTNAPAAEATAAPTTNPANELPSKDIKGNVTVWAFNTEGMWEEIADAFMKEYPGIKVETVIMPFGDVHDKLQTTLAAGTGAPDVAEVEMYQFNRYMTGGVLTNLLEEPYGAEKYKDLVHESNWVRWMTPDRTKLLGMPWDMTPGVYYYRADIFEELGLESDPALLGELMQDEEKFMEIIQTLSANNKYFMEWTDGPMVWAGDEFGYFDGQMNWTRNNEKMVKILDITKKGHQLKWAPHMDGFGEEGKQLLLKGDLVGLVRGSWGLRGLQTEFPDQSGKWRVTKLPLGINVAMGGSSMVMPAQSKNKDAAWAYMQWVNRSEDAWKIWTKEHYSIQPAWKDIAAKDWYASHTQEYLGGQEDFKFYESLNDAIPPKALTPVDGAGWGIFITAVGDALAKNTDSKTVIQQIQDDVMAQASQEIEAFKKAMKE